MMRRSCGHDAGSRNHSLPNLGSCANPRLMQDAWSCSVAPSEDPIVHDLRAGRTDATDAVTRKPAEPAKRSTVVLLTPTILRRAPKCLPEALPAP